MSIAEITITLLCVGTLVLIDESTSTKTNVKLASGAGEYNNNNPMHIMQAPKGVGYIFAIKK